MTTTITTPTADARERNLRRGFHPLEGRNAEQGEITRDRIMTEVEGYLDHLEECGSREDWHDACQQSRRLRFGREKRLAAWWSTRARLSPRRLLECA